MRLRFIAANLLNFFMAIVEGFLGLRFLLKLFGANANTGFVDWVYEMSDPLLAPFRGIFPAEVFENSYVIEFSTLFAMLMYAILGLVLIYRINAVTAAADTDMVVHRRR
jgi:YggT family protein